MASVGNLNEKAPITTSRSRIFSMLAIINVLENLLYFFSLALNNKVTKVSVIPANSNKSNGQYFEIRPFVKYENIIPARTKPTV